MKHKNFKYMISTQCIRKFMFSKYLFTLQYDFIYNLLYIYIYIYIYGNAKLITLMVEGFKL
jgi:hypothetical protein